MLVGICGVNSKSVNAYSNGSYFTKPAYTATKLYVIDISNMTSVEQTMIATLQGIVANKTSNQIYITDTVGKAGYSADAYTTFLNDLVTNYGITYETVTSAWSLVDTFKSYLNGYILYQAGNSSINVANTLAGIQNAIAVEASLENTAKAHGLSLSLDVKTRDEAWVKTNYWSQLNHSLVIEAKEEISMHLRDYATMSKALIFFDGNSSFRSSIMASLDADGVVMGWGDVQGSEETFIADSSNNGVLTIPADWGRNLSVLSGINVSGALTQNTHAVPTTQSNVHYVCFYVSDGDNLQWTINRANDPKWWGNSNRGTYKLGWTIPPLFVDLAPSVAKWYYNSAVSGMDNFIVGPSGNGFIFPESYPSSELDLHTQRLNDYMTKTDTRVVGVIGRGSFNNTSVWDRYTSKSNVEGLFYYEWSPYFGNPNSRQIVWSNGKPVIGTAYKLADGLSYAQNKTTVLNGLNSAAKNPYSSDGYSLVAIDAWNNYNLPETVKYIIDRLDPNVKVVTPEEYVKLIKNNLNPAVQGTNIALNKTATASGNVSNETPAKAVDGSVTSNSKWCQVYNGDKWLKLDLGQSYDISRWVVRHAGAGGESSSWNTRDFKLQKSSDGINWTDVDTVTGNTNNVTNRVVNSFNTRYVRLYITNSGADSASRIYEIELYK